MLRELQSGNGKELEAIHTTTNNSALKNEGTFDIVACRRQKYQGHVAKGRKKQGHY